MRLVDFAPLARRVSALGFGCASLGSRVDAKAGTAALGRAYESGVSWFDVAPSYGDGHAEMILGEFLAGRRTQVALCTKVGRLPAPESLAARTLKPVAQRALKLVPQLRGLAIQYRPPALRAELTGPLIESSIQESLKRLRTDHVDVLALHEPTLTDVQRDDVLRALDTVVSSGQASCIAVAGDIHVGLRAVALSERVRIIQMAYDCFTVDLKLARQQLPQGRSLSIVTHSVYGYGGALHRLTQLIGNESEAHALLEAQGYRGTAKEMAAAFLLDCALASNPEGVVLVSMYESGHLRAALQRLDAALSSEAVLALRNRLTALSQG